MTSHLALVSPSRATDAGWLAAADIAAVTRRLDVPYRLIGGLAVTLVVHAHGAESLAPARETADADLGVPFDVCGDDRLVAALLDAGYRQDQGNRFVRIDRGRELVIDVLAPSYLGRLVPNQPHGRLVMDEVPGLLTALALEPTVVDVTATLTDGASVRMTLHLPDVTAALVMKALTFAGRFKNSDAVDVHRLLEAAVLAGRTTQDWPARVEARDAAQVLHRHFGSMRPVAALGSAAARVRLLVARVVAQPASQPG